MLQSAKVVARSLVLFLTLAIEAYFFQTICFRYVELERRELAGLQEAEAGEDAGGVASPNAAMLTRVYASIALIVMFQVMSVASLLALSFSNPGYVSDYFVSKRVTRGPELGDID